MLIQVETQKEAIFIAGILTRAAISVHGDHQLHVVEQTGIANTLYSLRDTIEITEQDVN